jgi:hypothetical protein
MDRLGTEIFGAIEGDQHMIAKAAEARQTARPAYQRHQRLLFCGTTLAGFLGQR